MGNTNNGYQLLEISEGLYFDVSYDPDTGDDVIVVDGVESSTIHLTKEDLYKMLEAIDEV
jgi:hypothetical protein